MEEVVVTHNFKDLDRYIRGLPIKMKDRIGKFWELTTKFMQREIVRGFQQERDPDGNVWAPHSMLTTYARKHGRKSKRSPKILRDDGILVKSNIAVQMSPTELKIENTLPYAAPMQFGVNKIIGRTQAWWMVFNLFGFDPKAPWKFATTFGLGKPSGGDSMFKVAMKKGKKTVMSRMKVRRGLSWVGWRQATGLAMALIGKSLVIPPRIFLGFSKYTSDKIADIWTKWFVVIAEED